eukprot:183916-Pelagomonas_calceolata.AAC.1
MQDFKGDLKCRQQKAWREADASVLERIWMKNSSGRCMLSSIAIALSYYSEVLSFLRQGSNQLYYFISDIMDVVGVSSVSVESNLFNPTGSEPVHAFIIISLIATALFFTRFSMPTSPSAQGIPPAGHPIYCLPGMAYIMLIIFSKRSGHLAYWRQFSGYDPQATNSKKFTYHHWCALPTKPAH